MRRASARPGYSPIPARAGRDGAGQRDSLFIRTVRRRSLFCARTWWPGAWYFVSGRVRMVSVIAATIATSRMKAAISK
jgi:hypothetical protein